MRTTQHLESNNGGEKRHPEPKECVTRIPDVPALNQEDFANFIKQGDVIMFHVDNSMGHVIELTGLYSHTAIVVEVPDSQKTLLVCEAQSQVGFRCFKAWRLFEDYWGDNKPFDGRAIVYRSKTAFSPDEALRLYDSVMQLMGSLYSSNRIEQIVARYIAYAATKKPQRPILAPEFNHLICSEATQWLYRSVNTSRQLPPDWRLGAYTPTSIVNCSELQPVSELKRFALTHQQAAPDCLIDQKRSQRWLNKLATRMANGGRLQQSEQAALQQINQCWSDLSRSSGLFSDARRLASSNTSELSGSNTPLGLQILLGTGVSAAVLVIVALFYWVKKHSRYVVSRGDNHWEEGAQKFSSLQPV